MDLYESNGYTLIESYEVLNPDPLDELNYTIGFPANGSKPKCSFIEDCEDYVIKLRTTTGN